MGRPVFPRFADSNQALNAAPVHGRMPSVDDHSIIPAVKSAFYVIPRKPLQASIQPELHPDTPKPFPETGAKRQGTMAAGGGIPRRPCIRPAHAHRRPLLGPKKDAKNANDVPLIPTDLGPRSKSRGPRTQADWEVQVPPR